MWPAQIFFLMLSKDCDHIKINLKAQYVSFHR